MSEQTPEYEGHERRVETARLAEEVRELRNAVGTLSHRTEALSVDFQTVNQLQASQQDVDRRSAEAVLQAAKAVAAVREVEKTAVPREELVTKETELREAIASYRRRVVSRMVAVGVITLFVLAGLAVIGANYVSAQQERDYQDCIGGKRTTEVIRNYLTVVGDNSTNPRIKDAADDVVSLFATNTDQNCEDLR